MEYNAPSEIQKPIRENLENVMENGPGLRYSMSTYLTAKDTKNGRVLRAGLGGMGIGQMWFGIVDGDKDRPEWEGLPDINTETHDAYLNYFTGEMHVWERGRCPHCQFWVDGVNGWCQNRAADCSYLEKEKMLDMNL